jgi:DNA-binding SARP family transcriptional activator
LLTKPAQLTEAVTFYRDDFLSDLYLPDSAEFEDWAATKRVELHRQALEALTKHHIGRGAYDEAQTYAWHALEIDDLRESAHRGLMTALAASGQRTAALAQYQICQKRLRAELGVEPSAETTALYEHFQADPASAGHAGLSLHRHRRLHAAVGEPP